MNAIYPELVNQCYELKIAQVHVSDINLSLLFISRNYLQRYAFCVLFQFDFKQVTFYPIEFIQQITSVRLTVFFIRSREQFNYITVTNNCQL